MASNPTCTFPERENEDFDNINKGNQVEIEPVSTYGLGYMARVQGIRREQNPFPSVGQMYGNWFRGWDDANKDEVPKIKIIRLRKVIPMKLVK